MLKFFAEPFIATMADLGRAIQAYESTGSGWIQAQIAVEHLATNLPKLPLSAALRRQFRQIQESVTQGTQPQGVQQGMLIGFETGIHAELGSHTFLLIEAAKAQLYEQQSPPFGQEVADYFTDPEMNRDIAAATRCLALDEWTACVFHCMRVLEVGVRDFAVRIKCPTSGNPLQDWGGALTGGGWVGSWRGNER